MKKKTVLLLLLLFNIYFTQAQFYKSVLPSWAFTDSLTIIVQDFKKNYTTIEGTELVSPGEMNVYRSKVTLPGALHCTINRFHSLEDTTAGWQATMYEGDNYSDAVKIYKNTFRLVKKSKIKSIDQNIDYFIGEMQLPDEKVGFAVSTLRLNSNNKPYQHFVAEIELTGNYDGWEVHLNLHNKKNDTEE